MLSESSARPRVVDAQVHVYAQHSDQYPWRKPSLEMIPPVLTGDDMVAAMDAAGVDAAIIVSPWIVYRGDTRYTESVQRAHPDRFRMVTPIDPNAPGVERRVQEWRATPGAVGLRLLFAPRGGHGADHPGVTTAVTRAAAVGLPVNIVCWGRLSVIDELAAAFPDTQFVLDHLGMEQPLRPPPPDDPFAELDAVRALARHPNLAVKLTGACTYSHRPFPFDDLWEPVGRIIDAFGIERCLWGTDWQRATRLLTYAQSVDAFLDHWPLSGNDRAALMAENTRRIYDWDQAVSPARGGAANPA